MCVTLLYFFTTSAVECQNNGRCELQIAPDGTELELCNCERTYSGRDCSYPNTDCTFFTCYNGALCSTDGSDSCNCNTTVYSGLDCSQENCIGCDLTTGTCLTVPEEQEEEVFLTTARKVLIAVVGSIVFVVILPALYAMHNMRIEHKQRNERIKSHMQLERMTHAAYLAAKIQEEIKPQKKKSKSKSITSKVEKVDSIEVPEDIASIANTAVTPPPPSQISKKSTDSDAKRDTEIAEVKKENETLKNETLKNSEKKQKKEKKKPKEKKLKAKPAKGKKK
ncbi:hypothetical protein EB796_011316 [Bugula neritina]|uniref:EGF-like domain-containing protein n=1 Tax=Bugula neritina TaxID=10212 RepID=A0A7J7JXC2_BUGNE|nr:hypothetical protein EB796_011316 [Bugula neritina]